MTRRDGILPTSVTPDLFRGPLCGEEKGLIRHRSLAARWTPEQVRGDEFDKETDRASLPQQYAIALPRHPSESGVTWRASPVRSKDPNFAGVTGRGAEHKPDAEAFVLERLNRGATPRLMLTAGYTPSPPIRM